MLSQIRCASACVRARITDREREREREREGVGGAGKSLIKRNEILLFR
jgi:hypothetical protein